MSCKIMFIETFVYLLLHIEVYSSLKFSKLNTINEKRQP